MYENFTIDGYRVITDPNLTEPEQVKQVRTWKQRLFSLPWQPHKKEGWVTINVPKKAVLVYENNIICHPAVANELRKRSHYSIGCSPAVNNSVH